MKRKKDRRKQLKALKKESQRNLIEQIRRQLALPMNRAPIFCAKDFLAAAPVCNPSAKIIF
jgi:hypothetical protein